MKVGKSNYKSYIFRVFIRWKLGQNGKICFSALILKEAFHIVLKLTSKSFSDTRFVEAIEQI